MLGSDMRLPWIPLIIVAGCGHASHPATPPDHAGDAPDARASLATPDAGPPDADPTLAGCWPEPSQVVLAPPPETVGSIVGFHDGAKVATGPYWYCDLPDRVVLVDPTQKGTKWTGEVVSIPRATPDKLTRSKVARGSSCTDPCGNDGWAGCSEQTTCTVRSKVAGAQYVQTGYPTSQPFGAIHTIGDKAKGGAWCAPAELQGVFAICSTPTRTIEVRVDGCAVDDQGTPTWSHLVGLVYDGNAPRTAEPAYDTDGEVVNAELEPTHVVTGGAPTADGAIWTYTFHDPDSTLTFDTAAPSATLTFDGQTEDCFAFALGVY
jgi:hypothetical protein